MVVELYSDQRTHEYQGPTRFVSHPRACAVGGGTFYISKDGSRCVVAGNEVLRILRIRDAAYSQANVESGSRMVVGPGGSTIEMTTNMWSASGLKVDSAPTDVIWAHGIFDNKIVTSARNGEIVFWDLNKSGSKYDSRVKEHTRAINKLVLSPNLHYLFASGGQDGYLRLWDLRTPYASTLRVYHATGIRAISFCPVTSHPYHVCVGLESGNIQRWDLRNKAQPIERITLAHSSAVLSMDWQPPSMNETGLGWIVTSGMDRRVKIWDLGIRANGGPPTTTIGSAGSDRDKLFTKKMGPQAFRVLRTPFPVRSVKWRPGNDTEVGIISNNDNENDTVEIWDIRRGWIGKWSLEGVENAITDFSFCGSHKIWAQHINGSFAQHDLREAVRPLDAISRVSTTWSADGSLAFVGNHAPEVQVPYDDIHPHHIGSIQIGRTQAKATADPVYRPYGEQALGVLHISPPDAAIFRQLARTYILDGDSKAACQHNAEVATEAGYYQAAQTWRLLYSLLLETDYDNILSPSTTSQAGLKPNSSSASLHAPSIRSQQRVQGFQQTHQPPVSMTLTLNSRTSTPPRPTPLLLQQQQQPAPTSGSNTQSHKHRSPAREISPVSMMYDASMSSSRSSISVSVSLASRGHSRRASSVVPGRMLGSRPVLRRASVSSPQAALAKVDHVGEGALDDSDSEDEEQDGLSATKSVVWMAGRSRGRGGGVGRHVASPSPLSRVVARAAREESPDGHLASDERSIGEFEDEDSDEEDKEDATDSASDDDEDERRRSASRRKLHVTKQDSQSSIRTVTAEGHESLHVLPEHGLASSDVADGGSTRRPSPFRDRSSILPLKLSSSHLNDMLRLPTAAHISAAREYSQMAWRALDDMLERYAAAGDVMMCAGLVCVAPRRGKWAGLSVDEETAARMVEAYIDLLDRLQLHVLAAHLRKFANFSSVGAITQAQTTLYTSCGGCGTSVRSLNSSPVLCGECKARPTLCAICHIPVRALLMHCSTCGHGGHPACLRNFYLARRAHSPNTDVILPGSGYVSAVSGGTTTDSTSDRETAYFSWSDGDGAHGKVVAAGEDGSGENSNEEEHNSSPNASLSTASGAVVGAEREEMSAGTLGQGKAGGQGVKLRVIGHPCAAGCGHWCWAAGERFGG